MTLGVQVVWLFILAIPIACVAWTVTHEEIFREPREYCEEQTASAQTFLRRKFFYVWTCEYCFSHYVVIFFLILTRYKLLFPDWRGYVISGFSLVWVANVYMNLYSHVRLDIKRERVEIAEKENSIAAPEPSPPVVLTPEGASKEVQPDAVRR